MKIISDSKRLFNAAQSQMQGPSPDPRYAFVASENNNLGAYVPGAPGMGKTRQMTNWGLQAIYAGHGVCCVDVHEDWFMQMLAYLAYLDYHHPRARIAQRLCVIDPARPQYSLSFNPLQAEPGVPPERIAGFFTDILIQIFGLGIETPRLIWLMTNTFLVFTYLQLPMAEIPRWLTDREYRNQHLPQLPEHVQRFWSQEFPKGNGQEARTWTGPFMNKLGRILLDPAVRQVFSGSSKLTIRQMMDQQKWILVNLPKGQLGEDTCRLIGALLVGSIQKAALSRSTTSHRPRFELFVDECQNFITPHITQILSESRKYNLRIIMANQYLTQLPEDLRSGILNTVGTIACFRVGYDDARVLAKYIFPGPHFSSYLSTPLATGWDGLSLELANLEHRAHWLRRKGPELPVKVLTRNTPEIPLIPETLALVENLLARAYRAHAALPAATPLPVAPVASDILNTNDQFDASGFLKQVYRNQGGPAHG